MQNKLSMTRLTPKLYSLTTLVSPRSLKCNISMNNGPIALKHRVIRGKYAQIRVTKSKYSQIVMLFVMLNMDLAFSNAKYGHKLYFGAK